MQDIAQDNGVTELSEGMAKNELFNNNHILPS